MTPRLLGPFHTVLDHRWPNDGKQLIACTCPLGGDHGPALVIRPVESEPGKYWVRFRPGAIGSPDDDHD